MNRHVRTRHPQIYRKEVSKRVTCDNADISSDIDTPYAIKTEEIYASDHKDVDLDDVAGKLVFAHTKLIKLTSNHYRI